MFRLIYFNSSLGYQSFDYKDVTDFPEAEQVAKNHDAVIVCVVDYYHKSILHKCLDFNKHRDDIDHLIFDPKVMGLYY